MKIVIIDNYDSFTYNLSHLVKELGAEVSVVRNDEFELEALDAFDKIILSPGPGIPSEAGLLNTLLSLIDDPRNDIFLHIDKKVKTLPQLYQPRHSRSITATFSFMVENPWLTPVFR